MDVYHALPCGRPSAARSSTPLRSSSLEKTLENWSCLLRNAGIDATLLLTGSQACDLSNGEKPSCASLNKHIPSHIAAVLELDIRIIISGAMSPAAIDQISGLLDAEPDGVTTEHYIRWGRPTPTVLMYRYEMIDSNRAVEWEFCVVQGPFLEISPFWKEVFTPEEITWQRELRALARGTDSATLAKVKETQCDECSWRILAALAAYAEGTGFGYGAPDLDRLITPPMRDRDLPKWIDRWRQGESRGQGFARPTQPIPASIYEALTAHGRAVPSCPSQPLWVTRQEFFHATAAKHLS